MAVFSRRPQRSGSDSRRDWSNMIMRTGRLLVRLAARPVLAGASVVGGRSGLLSGAALRRLERERQRVDAVALPRGAGPIVEDVPEMPAAGAAEDLGAAHEEAVVVSQLDRLGDGRLGEARPACARVELGVGAEQHRRAGRAAVAAGLLV